MLQKEYDIDSKVEAYLLAEKIRVLLDAVSSALKKDEETPDIYILISVMKEILSKYLPKDE